MGVHGQRYIEISIFNRQSQIFITGAYTCGQAVPCGEVCISIRPQGWKTCSPRIKYDLCNNPIVPECPEKFMEVCAESFENGIATFTWPKEVIMAKPGIYRGVVLINGCEISHVQPVLIGTYPYVNDVEKAASIAVCATCDDDDICAEYSPCSTCGDNDSIAPYEPSCG